MGWAISLPRAASSVKDMTAIAFDDPYGTDIYTEPEPNLDTVAALGPLAALAGVWRGTQGVDTHPEAGGVTVSEPYVETWELQPCDPQTSGPQLLYGLRYHQLVHRPDDPVTTFHDQVGYLLWEPAAERVIMTLAIPRAQVAMAAGRATEDATSFSLRAVHGEPDWGICTNPFMERAFETVEWTIRFTVDPDGSWAYEQDTVMMVAGIAQPFHHTDGNVMHKVAEPTPNPLAG